MILPWKRQKPQHSISKPTVFPDGIAVQTESETYYIKGGRRYRLYSQRAIDSWKLTTVLATETAVASMPTGGVLGFRDGSLLRNIADAKLFLVSGNKLRQITSPDVFEKFGLDRQQVVEVSNKEIKLHEEGRPLE